MADNGLVRFKRWRRVVNGSFQYRTIALLLTIVLLGSALFLAALVAYYWAVTGSDSLIAERLRETLPLLLANSAVIMLVVIVVGRFASLKVAGPIFRVCRDIDRVLSGEKKVRVNLRQGDAFPELAEKVNALIEQIDTTAEG